MRRVFFLVMGWSSLAAGMAGIVLPLVPTTPFLLLAAACFCRSSPRLYQWLLHHPRFGPGIRNYREHRALPRRVKITALVLLWLSIGSTAAFVADALWLRITLLSIAVMVSTHLLRLATVAAVPVRDR